MREHTEMFNEFQDYAHAIAGGIISVPVFLVITWIIDVTRTEERVIGRGKKTKYDPRNERIGANPERTAIVNALASQPVVERYQSDARPVSNVVEFPTAKPLPDWTKADPAGNKSVLSAADILGWDDKRGEFKFDYETRKDRVIR
jgi:hypothetical protein